VGESRAKGGCGGGGGGKGGKMDVKIGKGKKR
jgi:hypothetical protein